MKKALAVAMLLGLAAADDADNAAYAALREKRAEKAPASEDCEDAATATARAAKARATSEKALLDTEKARLDAVLVKEKEIAGIMKGRSDDALALTATTRGYLDDAEEAKTAETKIVTDNEKAQVDGKPAIDILKENDTKASDAVGVTDGAVTKIKASIATLELAVTQHEEEEVALTKIWQDLVDAKKVITDSKTANILLKDKATEELDGCASTCKTMVQDGTVKILADMTTADSDAAGFVSTYKLVSPDNKDEPTLFGELKPLHLTRVKQLAWTKSKTDACAAITGPGCNAGDGITELSAGTWAVTTFAAYDTAKGYHDTALAALAVLKAKALIAAKNKVTANTNNVNKLGDISGLVATIGATDSDGEKKAEIDAEAACVAPLAAKDKVILQVAQAKVERDKAKVTLTALEKVLAGETITAANAAAALVAGSADDLAQKALVAAAKVELVRLDPYVVAAEKAGDRASAYFDFYNDFTKDGDARVAAVQAAIDALTDKVADSKPSGKIEVCEAKIKAADDMVLAAVVRCKRRQYSDALAALTKFNDDKVKQTEKETAAKTAYDKERKDAVAKNSDCRKDADGVRAECAEGDCCGQANRYDRDGTRMTIEVCGKPEDVSYTYWPVMKEGMAKAPQSEQWRYYCIMGAKNLAATTAAVAAVVYMAY